MTQIVLDRVADRASVGFASAPAQGRGEVAVRGVSGRPQSLGAEAARPTEAARTTPRTRQTRRPGQGSGRGAGPILRPTEGRSGLGALRRPVARAQSCVLPAPPLVGATVPAPAPATTWRLTDRGVAVVLVIGLMIAVAALTVVGLTALRVTGDGYQTTVSASLPR